MSERDRRVWTVAELAAQIKGQLEKSFAEVLVRGEVSALAQPASGHLYFTLKDDQAAIRCVLYRQIRRFLRVLPEEKKEFLVRGKVSAYGPRSEYQIVVDFLEPIGLGALYAAYLALQQKLAARGYFAQERKRPLPKLPRTIGIVTSLSGAALHDMLRIILARRPGQHVVVAPTLVQGDKAPAAIARAIRLLADRAAPDLVIVGRGGGSPEDLWCWNEEEVVRAVVECPVPVISGVGHETDVSLCDLAADVRAATPTHAAEMAVPDIAELLVKIELQKRRLTRTLATRFELLDRRLAHLRHRLRQEAAPTALAGRRLDELHEKLVNELHFLITRRRHQLELLNQRLQAQSPAARLAQRRQRLESLRLRLRGAFARQLDRQENRRAVLHGRLENISPLAVLERGYAIVTDARHQAVRRAAQTKPGDPLHVRVHQGKFSAVVTEVEPGE